jgi:predicted dehydrogenase
MPESELVAICSRKDTVVREVSDHLKVQGYTDYQKMLKNSDCEVVFIATPAGVHAEESIRAMRSGKHVYCTKPMATTLDEADEMIRTSAETGKKLEIGYHYRFDPYVKKVKSLIESAEIGRVHSTISVLQQYRVPEYWEQAPWRSRLNEAGGGVLMTNYSHEIDYVQWFFGDAIWVSGYTETLVHEVEVEDYASALIKFRNGTLSSFSFGTGAWGSRAPAFEAFGTEGGLSLIDSSQYGSSLIGGTVLYIFRNGKWNEFSVSQEEALVQRWEKRLLPWTAPATGLATIQSILDSISTFLSCVQNGDMNLVDGAEGRKSLELAVAIYESSKKRATIYLPLK